MRMNKVSMAVAVVVSSLGLGGACGTGETDDVTTTVQAAVETCVFGAPVIVETREETPGPVAPGISKVYFVTVRNTNSAVTCFSSATLRAPPIVTCSATAGIVRVGRSPIRISIRLRAMVLMSGPRI